MQILHSPLLPWQRRRQIVDLLEKFGAGDEITIQLIINGLIVLTSMCPTFVQHVFLPLHPNARLFGRILDDHSVHRAIDSANSEYMWSERASIYALERSTAWRRSTFDTTGLQRCEKRSNVMKHT